MLERYRITAAKVLIARDLVFAAITPNLHAERLLLLEEHLVERVEMYRIKVDAERLLLVHDRIHYTSLTTILCIELQVLDHITEENARLEHLNLIVDTR